MSYRPPPSDAFFGHVPHFIMWLCLVFVLALCGGAIANVLELSPSRQYWGILAGGLAGIIMGSILLF